MKYKSYYYLLLVLLMAPSLRAQYTTPYWTTLQEDNLKDQVKTIRFFFTHHKEDLEFKTLRRYKVKNDIVDKGYVEFDTIGMEVVSLMFLKDSINEPINPKIINYYKYYSNNIKEQALKEKKSKVLWPAFNALSLRLDVDVYSRGTGVEIEPNRQSIRYVYNYNDNNQISEEVEYQLFEDYDDDSWLENSTDYQIWSRILFYYNTQGQLIKQTIDAGETMKDSNYLSYNVHNLSLSFRAEMYRTFQYDDKGRLKEVSFFVNDTLVFNEKYSYDESGNFITKVDRYLKHIIKYYTQWPAEKMTASYNSKGDITELIFYPDGNEEQQVNNRYYEYEYDDHENWIKCKLYLEGNKNEPTLVAERIIEYYN
ncbi:hypothetical protein [Flavobacterium beibuense]|uniref:YD repeat-containing protein n=1 Tax=Flavobacterium beibuense TaxID=657326 RepID=A0A444W9Y4_9FLAO|nr:hypothetical protein [Flavobacterium beibuense]RYJ42456.1 hypothetical protein NU09_2242 [Flavobacterium beibuense]